MSEEPAIYHYVREKGKSPKLSEIAEFEASMQRVVRAHDELLRRLFGFVPEKPGDYVVRREDYARVMESVEQDFGLEEGDPDLVLFVLEQLSRSPRFAKD